MTPLCVYMSPLGSHRDAFVYKDYKKHFMYCDLLKAALEFADAMRYLHTEAIPGKLVVVAVVVVVVDLDSSSSSHSACSINGSSSSSS